MNDSINRKTVQDLIDHLQTLPKDLPIGDFWDESGEFIFTKTMPKVVDIVRSSSPLSRKGKRWVEDESEYDEELYEVYEKMKVVVL